MEKIAVLGAGNGGYACSADLSLVGYQVSVFEMYSRAQRHEPLRVKIGSDTVFWLYITFTVEHGLAVPGMSACQNSATVLVTEDSYESVTKYRAYTGLSSQDVGEVTL